MGPERTQRTQRTVISLRPYSPSKTHTSSSQREPTQTSRQTTYFPRGDDKRLFIPFTESFSGNRHSWIKYHTLNDTTLINTGIGSVLAGKFGAFLIDLKTLLKQIFLEQTTYNVQQTIDQFQVLQGILTAITSEYKLEYNAIDDKELENHSYKAATLNDHIISIGEGSLSRHPMRTKKSLDSRITHWNQILTKYKSFTYFAKYMQGLLNYCIKVLRELLPCDSTFSQNVAPLSLAPSSNSPKELSSPTHSSESGDRPFTTEPSKYWEGVVYRVYAKTKV